MFKKLIVFTALLFVVIVKAQKNDNVLFSIDDEKVYTSEFIRVYQKNKDIVIENEHKSFDDYFNLFVDFKLKLKQAYDLQLDTASSYINELEQYREQLVSPYLQDQEAVELLIKEAYDRMNYEVNASHILVRLSPDAKPKDTLLAYQKIIEARNKALNGIPFEQVAKQYSEDPSAKQNGGNLGYFSAFSMVYAFENAAFNTKTGDVSQPFRTQFGYHIVKVNDKRNSVGEVQVAHIMVKLNPEDSIDSKNKIFDIYNKLEQGGDFKTIAIQHSDDISSAKKGGILPKFGTGKMIKPFEEVAFSLQNEGDFSEPFKTTYGWHILKLLKKYPIKTFEDSHDYIENKIKNGNRSKYVEKSLANEIEKQYNIIEYLEILSDFYVADIDKMKSSKILLIIENKTFTSNDFYNFSLENKNKNIGELYDDFKNERIINYFKSHLEETNKEFAIIYQEYKDGLLLFELLQKNIWEKSEKDTIGLLKYFEANKSKYTWKKRAELSIASCTSLEKAKLVKLYLEENKTIDEIKIFVNEGATIHVLFSSGKLEEGNSKLPKNYEMKIGVSKIYIEKSNQYIIVKTDKIILPSSKKIDETRGEVINDYQIYLEEKWVEDLRKKYKIRLNKKALKKLKSQYPDL